MNMPTTLESIRRAHARIGPHVHRTPVLSSRRIDELVGAQLIFKCENFQRVGAFKARGACNAVLSLDEAEARNGVVTHSSGNHAAALALAARIRGIPAYIVMPENSAEPKKRAVAGYGAHITFCESTLKARDETAARVQQETGAALIHPYNDHRVIAGQGTAALELIEEIPDLDMVMTPVGGGGLLSGTAVAVKGLMPSIRVIGAEPAAADDAYRSFRAGHIIPATNSDTICDGLRSSLGDQSFALIRRHVDAIATASENDIVAAMRTLWETMKIIVEPSACPPLAVIMSGQTDVAGKRVGIILSGGNVDLDRLPW